MRALVRIGLSALLLLAAHDVARAIRLQVVDRDSQPIAEARACYVRGDQVERCAISGKDGWLEMPSSHLDRLRIFKSGFLVKEVRASSQKGTLELERAPELIVRLSDAETHEPVGDARLYVVYSTGEKKGPFPVNRVGVRVRSVLTPGLVRLEVESSDYELAETYELELLAENRLELTLRVRAKLAQSD